MTRSTVLIVDDDPQDLEILSAALREQGHEVLSAPGGTPGIALARDRHPDVVLLDVNMPGQDGREVCRTLRQAPDTRSIPIICMTGAADRDVRFECLDAGANDLIGKPVDPRELAARIRNLVRHRLVARAKDEWEGTMDCVQDMVLLVDAAGVIHRCNRAVSEFFGLPYPRILGRSWLDLFKSGGVMIEQAQDRKLEVARRTTDEWFEVDLYPGRDDLYVQSTIVTLRNVTTVRSVTRALEAEHRKLEQAYNDLKVAQSQIVQQEKMASIGQLAAGVAHEINNPVGFISSNLNTLAKYVDRLRSFFEDQASVILACTSPELADAWAAEVKRLKLDYIIGDTVKLIEESIDGANRVKTIVQDLKTFSRVDAQEFTEADINAGLESTLHVVWNELKYKAEVVKDLGELPQVTCNLGQLNQVFMNLLVNAAHAIDGRGEITIRTRAEDGAVRVAVADTGCGIPPENLHRIFEPFFTTKAVGKGTGLGLSISYDIVKKHGGDIAVESEPGKGTTFTVSIPVRPPEA